MSYEHHLGDDWDGRDGMVGMVGMVGILPRVRLSVAASPCSRIAIACHHGTMAPWSKAVKQSRLLDAGKKKLRFLGD